MLSYRLKSAIVGVERCSTGMRVTNIERGTVLTIPDTDNETGMIEIYTTVVTSLCTWRILGSVASA